MLNLGKSLHRTTKFSIIAFVVVMALGILSMGFLGLGLYYPASVFLTSNADINQWSGDWVWPAIILAGVAWSFGFLLAGIASHILRKMVPNRPILIICYILILWLWDVIIWFGILRANFG